MRERRQRKRLRRPGLSYRGPGRVFVTICAAGMKNLFGRIIGERFGPSWIGAIVREEWERTFALRKGLAPDEFVVMPNHFHAIVHMLTAAERFSEIMAGFKSAVTSRVRKQLDDPKYPVWKRGSYDHVIEDREDLGRIREYIRNNVRTWARDRLYAGE